jgi:hypothetical protein
MRGICQKGNRCPLFHAKWSAMGEFIDAENSID